MPKPGEIDDLVPGLVQGRANQRIHAGINADIAHLALALGLGDPCQQHTGLGHQKPARLHPQLELRIGLLHFGKRACQGDKIQRLVARTRRHAQAATDIENPDAIELFGKAGELHMHAAPVRGIEDAGTQVRVQTDDARTVPAGVFTKGRNLIERNTELGLRATRAHLVVMAAPNAQVHAQEDVATGKVLAPFGDRMQSIKGDKHAGMQRSTILLARSKVGREQDAFGLQIGDRVAHGGNLVPRHALESESFSVHGLEDLRMRIGLERVMPAVNRRDGLERLRLRAHLIEAVDVTRACLLRQFQQSLSLPAPPGRLPTRGLHLRQFAPTGSEHATVGDTHDIGLDQQCMQARNQRIDHAFIDHEGEVEIVGRLRDEVHIQGTELGQNRRQAVQHRAHAATDQGDGGARRDDLDPATGFQIGAQARQHIGVEQVVGRIQRHGDVGFRRTNQVHRQAMALEGLEHIGKKADLLPHADRFHRDQGQALARADCLDAGHRIARFPADLGTRQFRPVGIADANRHARIAHRMDAARMQHLGPGGGDFLGLGIVQAHQQTRIRHLARIGAEHAGYVGPDFHGLGVQQGTEVRRRRIRSTTTEHGGVACILACDKSLGNEHVTTGSQTCGNFRRMAKTHRGRQPLPPFGLVGQCLGAQEITRIQPQRVES